MGVLHRAYARSIADVWDTQTRLLHSVGMVRSPIAAQWLVTAACDLKCPHCYSAAGRRLSGELSTTEAKRLVIDPLVELGCGLLVLAGGELLLRRDIPELVDYACSRGLRWAMHTHGLHVPKFESLLRRHPPALAAISLDGDRSFHDAFRGREGSYDAAFTAAELLAAIGGCEVVFGTTVTRTNADAVADMFPRVAASEAHSWGLHLFAPEGRGHDHAELFPTPGQLRRVAAFARRRRRLFPIELCNEWGSAGRDDLYYRDQPFTCGAGTTSLVVSATGDVLPCTTTDPAESEGNVRQTPLAQLWRRRFGRFRSGSCTERGECWLQTRNDVRCAQDAFGPVARTEPLWAERIGVAPAVVRAATSRRVLHPRAASAVGLAAAGLVFLQGCVKPVAAPGPTGQANAGDGDEHAANLHHAPWAEVELAGSDRFPAALPTDPETQMLSAMPTSDWGRFRSSLVACEAGEAGACDVATRFVDKARVAFRSRGQRPAWEPSAQWDAYIEAWTERTPHSFSGAAAVLRDMERRPTFDPTLAGQLWRAVRDLPVPDAETSRQRVRLFAALHRHHRVIDALTQAEATAGPVEIRPWLKKSGPSMDHSRITVPGRMMRVARRAYPSATATTWDTVAQAVSLRADAILARAGEVTTVRAGGVVMLGRLDVLFVPSAAQLQLSPEFVIHVPAGSELTLHTLPGYLSADDREVLRGRVEAAANGDDEALEELSRDLGIAHVAIAEFVAAHPGAAALRTLLVGYDE